MRAQATRGRGGESREIFEGLVTEARYRGRGGAGLGPPERPKVKGYFGFFVTRGRRRVTTSVTRVFMGSFRSCYLVTEVTLSLLPSRIKGLFLIGAVERGRYEKS